MDSNNMDEFHNDDSNNIENMPSTSQVLVLNNQSFNLSVVAKESNEKNKVNSDIAYNNENLMDQIFYENDVGCIDFSDDELKEYVEVCTNKIEEDNHLIKQSEKECISKFLSGELSFAEYANQMENDFLLGEEDVIPSERKVENESENFDDDINKINSTKNDSNEGRKAKKKYSKRRNLPPALKGLMGEANLRYARGDKQLATDICLEIIRQVPTAPEPYLTLAGLYEEQGYTDKSLQMSLIAAHLSPYEANWVHLAELSLELGHRNQAIICYNKALRVDYKQIDVHLKRGQLLEEDGQTSSALKNYSKLLSSLDPVESSDRILELSKMIAEKYHNEKDLNKTKETLEVAINKCPQLISSEHINLYLEVLLSLKEYSNCLEVFINFCDVAVEFEANNDEVYIVNCDLKKDLDIDIKVKLIITLIHMKYTKPLEDLVNSLLSENILEVGDLYVDVAEAYMMEELYEDALKLLTPLIACDKFSLPAVWLRYGECLKNTGDIEKSVSAYLKVVKEVPLHDDARLMAAELLTKLGRRDEAINILEQKENSEIINPDLLYERCLLLKNKPDQVNEFLAAGQLFLSRHFIRIRSFEELRSLSNHKASSAKKKSSLNEVRMISGHLPVDQDRPNFIQGKKIPTLEEEWDLFKSMCNLCLKYKKCSLLQRLVFSAQGSDLFTPYSQDLDLMCLMASYYNHDSYLTFNYARQLVLKDINLAHPWNVLNLLVIHGDDMRHNKFIIRLLTRNPTNSILSFLHANNCLVSGTYKYALNEYAAAFRKEPSAMLAFLIGISLSQMACQKFSAKKHSLVTQALAFFSKYKELRGEAGSQEYHYNIGRFYHQLGLLPSALFHYKESLKTKPSFISDFGGTFDLSREAAYNIHLIYLQSGAHDTARMYLEKYIVI